MESQPPHPPAGRFDVHSHLLPGVDDGCRTLEESVECARRMVAAGYSHSFCTPHIWPNLPQNTVDNITRWVADLQQALDAAGVPLRLHPGGEINLREDTIETAGDALVTFGMRRRFVLIDLWADRLPPFFVPSVRWLQSQGVRVVLAHPERMRAVQLEPELMDYFGELGLVLQGNLQCLGDPPGTATRDLSERFLLEGKYFLLGSDLHNLPSLGVRLNGLQRAITLVGESTVNRLTVEQPRTLLSV